MTGIWPWIAFNTGVLVVLAIDLGLLNRRPHTIGVREAAAWSAVWIALALALGAAILVLRGRAAGLEFLAGYLIEYSLSIDNIFVMVLVFAAFGVRDEYQHRVLFWGILGALVMRGLMIAAGSALIHRFHWITYVFGLFLVVTGVRMALGGDREIEPERNPVLRLVRRFIPVTDTPHGQRFIVTERDAAGRLRRVATPLFVVLIVIETMDLVFAVDSIPAVFAVTHDPFIVYTSNVSAVLGLRSLYFLLAGVIDRFHYLRYGLAVVLAFVGAKMLAARWYAVPTAVSLLVIAVVLAGSVLVSLAVSRRRSPPAHP